MVFVNCKLIADSWKEVSKLESNKENSPGWKLWQPSGVNESKPRINSDPVLSKLAVVSS